MHYVADEWVEARHIIYVPGNHEFYETNVNRGRMQIAED